jgi:4-carboxymuconolactone decarboxylase
MKRGRLEWYHPDELTDEQRPLYEAIVRKFTATGRPTPLTDPEGRLEGPFNAMLASPAIGSALQATGNALRFPGVLPRNVFEAIVLIVGVERRAEYEWYAHAPLAEGAGVSRDAIEAVFRGKYESVLTPPVLALVRATLAHVEPSAETVSVVEAEYGVAGVTEIVVTTAYYDLIAALLRTWDTPLPEGVGRAFR